LHHVNRKVVAVVLKRTAIQRETVDGIRDIVTAEKVQIHTAMISRTSIIDEAIGIKVMTVLKLA
jgi:hypothetical protein